MLSVREVMITLQRLSGFERVAQSQPFVSPVVLFDFLLIVVEQLLEHSPQPHVGCVPLRLFAHFLVVLFLLGLALPRAYSTLY